MDKQKKFQSFLEGIKGLGHDKLIDTVQKGFGVYTESLAIEPLDPDKEVFEEGGKSVVMDNDLKLKSGEVIPSGESVKLNLVNDGMSVEIDSPSLGRTVKIRIASAYRYLSGFDAPPSEDELAEMMDSSSIPTPTGYDVEPDGHGPDGSPSWFLIMGLI
jgi:hypothetical protein